MVAGCLARVEQPLQLGHGQDRGGAFGVLSVRRPGAAPGPREAGHERHLSWKSQERKEEPLLKLLLLLLLF